MSPELIVAMLSSAIAALFGALMVAKSDQVKTYRELYEDEREEHRRTRQDATLDLRENTRVVREMTEQVGALMRVIPRRYDDWQPQSSGRRQT